MVKALELTGQVFSRLVVLERGRNNNRGNSQWICLCDPELGGCGKRIEATGTNLKSGNTNSCGCYHKELIVASRKKHGYSQNQNPTYIVWCHMTDRCNNPNSRDWENYGGRGIKICLRWHDFRCFLEDMGDRPEGKTINRINNDGNYELENCEWVGRKEQNRNTRRNHFLTFNGQTKTVAEWAEELGISYPALINRIYKGMPPDVALTKPVSFFAGSPAP